MTRRAQPDRMKTLLSAMRRTFTSRDITAGCFECSGSDPKWTGPQAQGTAARHHDATGHETWADVHMSVRYGLAKHERGAS